MATGLEKVSFHSNTKERQCQRSSNFHTITLISHAGKIMLKILPARLQQYVNRELPDVQDGFRKSKGARDQIGNIQWIIDKAREFQKKRRKKKIHSFTDYEKAFVWIPTKLWKILKWIDYQTTLPVSKESSMEDKKQ